MKTKFDWIDGWSGLPDMSQEALKNYFIYAFEPGGFLTSLLRNDPWSDVIARADHWNKSLLAEYLLWLHDYAPRGSWGSPEAVDSWLNKGPAYQEFSEKFHKDLTWDILNTEHKN